MTYLSLTIHSSSVELNEGIRFLISRYAGVKICKCGRFEMGVEKFLGKFEEINLGSEIILLMNLLDHASNQYLILFLKIFNYSGFERTGGREG